MATRRHACRPERWPKRTWLRPEKMAQKDMLAGPKRWPEKMARKDLIGKMALLTPHRATMHWRKTFHPHGEPVGVRGEPVGVRGEPVRGEPVRGGPVRGEPVRGEPVRGEPVRGEPVRGGMFRASASWPGEGWRHALEHRGPPLTGPRWWPR